MNSDNAPSVVARQDYEHAQCDRHVQIACAKREAHQPPELADHTFQHEGGELDRAKPGMIEVVERGRRPLALLVRHP